MIPPLRLHFNCTFYHLHSVWLPSRQLTDFQMMIHVVIVARWGTKGFQFARFIYFFVPGFVLIVCCFRRVATAYSKRLWRSHSRLLWLGMLPVVIRSRFSGPSGALVKQRWVNFSLFTLCVSSPVFRVTSGSGRFYGWQFDSRHDSYSPAEARARRDSVLLSDKTFLQIHELLFGFESRLLASPRWWF